MIERLVLPIALVAQFLAPWFHVEIADADDSPAIQDNGEIDPEQKLDRDHGRDLEAANTDTASVIAPRADRWLGIGGQRALAGSVGPHLSLHFGRLMVNAMFTLANDNSADASRTFFVLAGGLFYELKTFSDGALMLGGRVDLAFLHDSESTTDLVLEVPLRAQWMLTELLALHLEVGVTLGVGGDTTLFAVNTANASTFTLGAGSGFTGAGFTLYWP